MGLFGKSNIISDHYKSLDAIIKAMQKYGLESSDLMFAIDFTKSNKTQGKKTFGGRSLHDMSGTTNPYQQCIKIVLRALEPFDDDGEYPVIGFGDVNTKAKSVFAFTEDGGPCRGVDHILERYKFIAETVKMSGPTNFAPAIMSAIEHVKATKRYHILVIIADGKVADAYEDETISAIREASNYPLSIIMVGVGDGKFDKMKEFDDKIKNRKFDNFQFANFSKYGEEKEDKFILDLLQELPKQYKAIVKEGLLN